MSAAEVPYLLLGDSRRDAIAARVARSVEKWQRAWLPDTALSVDTHTEDLRIRPTDIRAHEAACFRSCVGKDLSLVLVVPRRSLAALVGVPSHGMDASSRFADDNSLAAALEREALARLATALLSEGPRVELERLTQSTVDVFRETADARFVCVAITLGDSRCTLDALLSPALVERLLPSRSRAPDGERVEKRRMAAAAQNVEVEGVLGFAEVSVSELAALSIGDVIVLDQKLGDACAVNVSGGGKMGGASLGRVDGKRAIQIKGRVA